MMPGLGAMRWPIWLIHFQTGINLTDCWNVVWDEWLKLCVEVYLLWLVSLNIFEEIFDILRNLEICVLCWVISPWYIFILITIFVII